jgi:hypothetical protein
VFEKACSNFSGNERSENYIELVGICFPHNVPWGATCNPLGFFSRKIWEPSLTSTVNGAIRIYPERKKRYSGK